MRKILSRRIQYSTVPGFLLVLLCYSTHLQAARPQAELTHQIAPLSKRVFPKEFTLKNTQDEPQDLKKYRGKVVIVNFWAVWCPPCRNEMPSLQRLYTIMQGRPVEILAINEGEDSFVIERYLFQLKPTPTFPILLDTTMEVASQWGVLGLPTSFVLDKQGRLAYKAVGGREFDHPEIIKIIDTLLKE